MRIQYPGREPNNHSKALWNTWSTIGSTEPEASHSLVKAKPLIKPALTLTALKKLLSFLLTYNKKGGRGVTNLLLGKRRLSRTSTIIFIPLQSKLPGMPQIT